MSRMNFRSTATHPVRPQHGRGLLVASLMVLAGLAAFGCSNSGNPTRPYGDPSTDGAGGAAAFDSGSLTAPASFVRVFPSAVTVGYHCTFHVGMGMVGTVRVAAGAADSVVITASGSSFAPVDVTIRPGGYVRWNVTAGTHTVTTD